MANYTRSQAEGGTFFFTVRLQDRQATYLTDHIDHLRTCVRATRARSPFEIAAACVLPDHLHMIWTLPSGDSDYSKRWRLIKSMFSRHLPAPEHQRSSHLVKGDKGIWQRRFWEHRIRDAADFDRHSALIYRAPVYAGLVSDPKAWPYSSLRRDVRQDGAVRGVGAGAGAGYQGKKLLKVS